MARQRKPTALKLLDGNPGKTRIEKEEVKPKAASVRAPKGLRGQGLTMWKRVAPELKAMGLWTIVDREGLEHACKLHTNAMEAEAEGNIDQYLRLTQAFRLWVKEFGFTPVSRSGLRAPGASTKNPFEAFK